MQYKKYKEKQQKEKQQKTTQKENKYVFYCIPFIYISLYNYFFMNLENISVEMDEVYPEPSIYIATTTSSTTISENIVYVENNNICINSNNTVNITKTNIIPKLIFIVPYRDRHSQYCFFKKQMKDVLEDISSTDYKIYFVHQCDTRAFNRGAIKNIGFIAVKEMYPEHYGDITLVFNDIDTMPLVKNIIKDYNTQRNVVKHFFGFTFALGGIFSIKAGDFEKINGFPTYWSWGYEDNEIQKRCLKYGIKIDRSNFSPMFSKDYLLLHDDIRRIANRQDFDNYLNKTNIGVHSIYNLKYEVDEETQMINVTHFDTLNLYDSTLNKTIDLRKTNAPFSSKKQIGMNFL